MPVYFVISRYVNDIPNNYAVKQILKVIETTLEDVYRNKHEKEYEDFLLSGYQLSWDVYIRQDTSFIVNKDFNFNPYFSRKIENALLPM